MQHALRERALRLLAHREYTRQELSTKIAPLAESPEQLAALVDELTASDLLSDQRYASTRINSRAGRLGDARLAHELRVKGVSTEVVQAALAAGEDELTRARRVWERRFGCQPIAAVADATERARQIRFLAGRGFSAETIRRVLHTNSEE
jgi:regulatory protein